MHRVASASSVKEACGSEHAFIDLVHDGFFDPVVAHAETQRTGVVAGGGHLRGG
jgi:hypothetical protein